MAENESLFQSPELVPDLNEAKPTTQTRQKPAKLQVQLPYLASPGTIKTALDKVRQASVPEKFTTDFVSAKLGMKGGSGAAIIPFFKKIGLVAPDGSPTELYRRFRNVTTGGSAIGEAIKRGYKALLETHEYFYELGDKELSALIVQVTGTEAGSSTAKAILYAIKALKEFADFSDMPSEEESPELMMVKEQPTPHFEPHKGRERAQTQELGLNLSYTINLNLPATSDISVFNAIFKSLKEHLLANVEE